MTIEEKFAIMDIKIQCGYARLGIDNSVHYANNVLSDMLFKLEIASTKTLLR